MSSQAPYWGDLPPQTTRTNSKRERDHAPRGHNGGLSVDTGVKSERLSSQSHPQRYSAQTDAPTLSTQSPFESPIASEFRGDGLAPRPPSFPYGSQESDRNDEFYERRKRRESRNRDQFNETQSAVPPPTVPDVPKAPPLSYRAPQGSRSQYPQDINRVRSSKHPEGSGTKGPPEQYYQRRDPYPREGAQQRRPSNGKAVVGDRAVHQAATPQRGDSTRSQPRKGSLSEAEAQQRREWAPDRSPLQRLELTLDGITKEEKRARVEEAELVAREAKAGRGGDRLNTNSVRSRNHPVVTAPEVTQPAPQTLPEAGLVRSLSNKHIDQLQRSGTVERKRPSEAEATHLDKGFEYEPGEDIISTKPRSSAGVPGSGASTTAPVAGVARSTSNKLRKDPPGDPWYNRRKDAEKQHQDIGGRQFLVKDQSRNQQAHASTPSQRNGRAAEVATNRQTGVEKDLPLPPPGRRDVSNDQIDTISDDELDASPPVRRGTLSKVERLTGQRVPADQRDEYSDNEPEAKPVRRGTLSKIERLIGQRPPQDEQIQHSEEDLAVKPTRRTSLLRRLTGKGPKPSPQSPRYNQAQDIRTEVVKVNGVKYEIPPQSGPAADSRHSLDHDEKSVRGHRRLHLSDVLHRHENAPGESVYIPSNRLDEWKKGGVALLAGHLLDLDTKEPIDTDKDKAWWEGGDSAKRKKDSTKQRKAEAYDGEYDETNAAPTRFKPALFLKCGPLLRYCGMRRERLQSRSQKKAVMPERDIWRGTIMIVTQDSHSSYELAPTLRLFLQPVDLLPPPPEQVNDETGELPPEYVDPLAGLPKVGRDGRTLYIRPVDHLEEGKDLSLEESDDGLFEMHRSPLDGVADKKPLNIKPLYDGEKAGKYKEVRGFRLHAEHGMTFWRFNIEVELRDEQQRIAYRINRGPATAFWVPAKTQSMNIMFYSCNGFSHSVNPNNFSGPDPLWRDVLNTHQTRPFHVMLGGGDQIYNDAVMYDTTLFQEWLEIRDPIHKARVPFTPELQKELEMFYLNRYAMWFSQGLFGVANSQIPMINIYDDHDIIDGFGSYPHHYMRNPVMSGLGAVAFKYYMLFQHQSSIDEGEETEPSWVLGTQPGPYIQELSRSVITSLGRHIIFLGLDCRTERMNDEVVSAETYHKIFDRLEKEIVKGETKHLIVMVGVPVAYPRMVWLENILTSRAIAPLKAMGRAGLFGKGLLNRFDGGVEVLDDLDDHWTARHHKEERNWFIQELQDLAAEKSVRVTILGGDVHLGAIGQFYSNPKLEIPKDKDHRYMPNIISSAIVNTPPPNTLADILNRRNKVHHLDDVTDEDMIPIFTQDVNGKARNNKRLLNRRNWCSIRSYDPTLSPPPTPRSEGPPTPPQTRGGLFRRLSTRGPSYRPDAAAPPLSNPNFFNRRPSTTSRRASTDSQRPNVLTRTLSLTRKDFMPGLFRRNSKHKDEINGYGSETDDGYYTEDQTPPPQRRTAGIRGGAGRPEDLHQDGYFPAMPPSSAHHPVEQAPTSIAGAKTVQGTNIGPGFTRTAFHRTPTGLSEKQAQKAGGNLDINLEGGLDICLNMEVNQKDPAGITVPYRMLVPALWYEDGDQKHDEQKLEEKRPVNNLKRLISLKGRPGQAPPPKGREGDDSYSDDDSDDSRRGYNPGPASAPVGGKPGARVPAGNPAVRAPAKRFYDD